MREKFFRKAGKGLSCILATMLFFSTNLIPVLAEESNVSIQNGNVQTASDWSQVQGLIDAASENDIVDITALQLTTGNITLNISKNIVIKCEPTNKPYAQVAIKDLFFQISNNATLTLENVAIMNTKLDTSIIRGTGHTVISKSILEPDNSNGTPSSYNPPATIDLQGDVIVKTDEDLFSSIVSGATIIERNSGQTGKAGTAIKAVNVTVNGGRVVGGASFESNCNSGDGIVASGNVTVNGVRQNGDSNANVQSGSVGQGTINTIVGMPVRFTENDEKQRVLHISGGDVFGSTQSGSGSVEPYSIKMSKNDIAIIDSSKIGWYTNIPVFSDGFYYITNPIATWGTLDDATKVYPLTAVNATLSGTKAVTVGNTTSHYAAENERITVTADAPASGQQFKEWTVAENSVTFENSKNATTIFTMPAKIIEITATYEAHVHTPSITWSKDSTNHWHECTANDGEKMDVASHTFDGWIIDTPATETTKGSKHRDCTICEQRETVEIPMLSSKDIIIDDTTGTKIEYEDGSVFGSDISLVVTPKTKEEVNKYQEGVNKVAEGSSLAGLYDIKLLKDGAEIQPDGKLKITLQLTDEMKKMSDLQVVYIDDNGDVTIIPSQLIDGKLVFVTDHFSYYGVIGKEKSTGQIQPESPSKPNSPQTGDTSNTMLYLAFIVLSGCLVGYGFKRKKALRK